MEDSGGAKKRHAVALAYPMQGHINPMMHLCKMLCSYEGISITLVNTEENHARLEESRRSAGLPGLGEQGFDLELVAISDGLHPGDDCHRGKDDDALQRSLVAAERMRRPFLGLLAKLREEQGRAVDCIISDAFLGWTQEVARELGIPRVALWASSTAYLLLNYNLPLLNQRGFAPIRDAAILEEEGGQSIDFIEGVPPLHSRDLPSILQSESGHDPGFRKRAERARKLGDDAWVLTNTFEALEGPSLAAAKKLIPRLSAVGPLLPSAYLGLGSDIGGGYGLWNEDQRCMDWLDKQRPSSVVYISFGSLAIVGEVQMRELAEGIEASQQAFLWVVRGVDLEKKYSWLSGFVERTRSKGLVVDWAPQLQVLFHPSVGGFLSHCGWNSTLESIAMGVPLIGLPVAAEQNLNCKHAAVDWKVGCRLEKSKKGFVESGEIERVVTRFMSADWEEGMELRIRARELREAARWSMMMEEGSSRRNLDEFVQALMNNSLR